MSNLKYYFQFVLDARFIPSEFPLYRKQSVTHSPAQRIFHSLFHFTAPSSPAVT